MELGVEPKYVRISQTPGESEKGTLTGTVTRFRETLLIAIFIAYKTLNMTNAMVSDVDNLFWTKKRRANRLHPPRVPHNACRAVTVYG